MTSSMKSVAFSSSSSSRKGVSTGIPHASVHGVVSRGRVAARAIARVEMRRIWMNSMNSVRGPNAPITFATPF